MVDLTIPQKITADIYHRACGQIDGQNRWHQERLDIKKLGTKDWPKRFNLSIFTIYIVDVRLEYQGITSKTDIKYNFYNYLVEGMINNTYYRFVIQHA